MDGTYSKRWDKLSTCVWNDLTVNRDKIVTVGEVISSSCVRHTFGISPAGGKTQTSDTLAHPATLTILGSKVSTCFRSAFMVFPVSTMALGKGRAKRDMGEGRDGGHLSAEWNQMCRSLGEKLLIFHVQKEISSRLYIGKNLSICYVSR